MSIERVEEPDELHEFRYAWASRYTTEEDVVIDAACGSGYGGPFLKGTYVGVDKSPGRDPLEALAYYVTADLQTWDPGFAFDVFIGLETIEHLDDYSNYVEVAKRAHKFIVISTPVVPTTEMNQFHVHDFEREDIETLFVDADWELAEYEEQAEVYGLWAFRRRQLAEAEEGEGSEV